MRSDVSYVNINRKTLPQTNIPRNHKLSQLVLSGPGFPWHSFSSYYVCVYDIMDIFMPGFGVPGQLVGCCLAHSVQYMSSSPQEGREGGVGSVGLRFSDCMFFQGLT